jgi:hypothetical protein
LNGLYFGAHSFGILTGVFSVKMLAVWLAGNGCAAGARASVGAGVLKTLDVVATLSDGLVAPDLGFFSGVEEVASAAVVDNGRFCADWASEGPEAC